MRASRVLALVALACVLSGHVQAVSPLLAYKWMPWRDEAGTWHKPAEAVPDFTKMTLADLPSPELYLQVALTSPYAVPQVPLNTIVNNTIATLSGGALTSAAKEWVQMAGDAGSYVTKSMPLFIQTALQTVLEGVQVNGKPVMQLPALKEATLDTATALKALPQLLNITMAGMEINKLTGLADQLHIKLPTMSSELTNSIEELKKIPQLLQPPKQGLTVEDLMRLPQVLEQVATTATNAADAFGKQIQAIQLPKIEEFFDDTSALSLRNFIQKSINVELPHSGPVEQVLLNITKAVPAVASQLGLKIDGLDKLPGVIEALENAVNAAKQDGLVVTDKAGRIDLAASLSQLPDKVPLVQKIVSSVVPPPSDLPSVQASLEKLQSSLTRLSEISAAVLNPTKRSQAHQAHHA